MHGLQRILFLGTLLLLLVTFPTWANEATPTTPPRAESDEKSELIKEVIRDRYPNGQIKMRREVARTVDHNYVNHGECLMWDEANNFMAGGRFELGLRVGTWKRVFKETESPLFTRPEYQKLFGPFTSQADFEKGRLQGIWTMADGEDRTLFTIPFVSGLRHGTSVFYHPNGKVARETSFNHGQYVGWDRTYDEQGELISEAQYIDGRKFTIEREMHLGTKVAILEAGFVYPSQEMVSPDDWWTATLAEYRTQKGEPVRHGHYTASHASGKLRVRGTYHMGQPVGEFTWYHSDGERAIQGQYVAGKEDGMWNWWHPNGMKRTEGAYRDGVRIGQWLNWQPDGFVASVKNYSLAEQAVAPLESREANEGEQPAVQLLRRSTERQSSARR